MKKQYGLLLILCMAAHAGCSDDAAPAQVCGNGILELGEVCDSTRLGGVTCEDVGDFTAGTLVCNDTCDDYDTDRCEQGCPVAAQDVTSSIGASITVDTADADDDFTGSCATHSAPDVLLSFVAPETAQYVVTTITPGTDYDTLLMAFTDCQDPTGSELACNDDAGDLRSLLLVDATAGDTLYVVVDGYNDGGTAQVSIAPLVCGDGAVVPTVEQCDDGNTTDGDGCSATCVWECTDDAQEDDDSEATATVLTPPFPISGGGVLCHDDTSVDYDFAVDFYTLDIEAGEALDATISAGTRTDCTQQNLVFQFLDPGLNNILASATSDGTSCPAVQGVATLSGTRVVMAVFATAANAAPQDYSFTLTTRTIVCGDSITDPGEECDDGNTMAGDGCENDCTTTPMCNWPADLDIGALVSATPTNVVVDLTAQGHDYNELSCIAAEGGANGADYMVGFTVTTGGTLSFDVDHTGGDVMYGLFADDTSCTELDCFDIYPDVTGELTTAVTPGNYRLVVQAYSPSTSSSVTVTLTAP